MLEAVSDQALAATDTNLADRVDAVIEKAVDARRIVGTVVLVSRNGRLIHRRAAGSADREAGRAMTADTIFRLSSVTKPVVSAAALALVEQGALQLDKPVETYVPEFRPRDAHGGVPRITMRHLMTHTAGLAYGFAQPPSGPYNRAGVSDGLDQPGLSIGENLARIVSVPLSFEPGTAWAYSVATDILGVAMARATGAALPELVERLVTRPLAMNDTAFVVRDRDRLSAAYADALPEPVRMAQQHHVPYGDGLISYSPDRAFDARSFASGGTGLNGTAGDILNFLEALRTGGAPVVGPASVQALATDALGDVATAMPGWGWSLGFAILGDPIAAATPQSPGTWRWGGVYGHSWFVDPAKGLVVVVLTNTAIAGMTGAFPEAIRDAVYGEAAPVSAREI